MFSLDTMTALVTGASGGIGAAIAKTLHKQGANVILHGTNQEKLTALQSELGERSFVVTASLKDEAMVNGLIAKSEEVSGNKIDILVNNAGITKDNLLLRMKIEDYDDVMNVNLRAAFLLSKNILKSMMKKRFGRIINITSVVGVTGNPGQANYCASKAGMIGMTKSMAQEIATRGITVNAVAPGFIASPMTDALTDEQSQTILQNIPQKILGQPEDIANAVLYLASKEANYMTGQTLHVNGGMAMI